MLIEKRLLPIRTAIAAANENLENKNYKGVLDALQQPGVRAYFCCYYLNDLIPAYKDAPQEKIFLSNLESFREIALKNSPASTGKALLSKLQDIEKFQSDPVINKVKRLTIAGDITKVSLQDLEVIKNFYQEIYLFDRYEGHILPHVRLEGFLYNLRGLIRMAREQGKEEYVEKLMEIKNIQANAKFNAHTLIKKTQELKTVKDIINVLPRDLFTIKNLCSWYLRRLARVMIPPNESLEKFLNNLESLMEITDDQVISLSEKMECLEAIKKQRDYVNQVDFEYAEEILKLVDSHLAEMKISNPDLVLSYKGVKIERNSSNANRQTKITATLSVSKSEHSMTHYLNIPIEELTTLRPQLINSYRWFPEPIGLVMIPRKDTLGKGAFGKVKPAIGAKIAGAGPDYSMATDTNGNHYIIKVIELRGKKTEKVAAELKMVAHECAMLRKLGRSAYFYEYFPRGKATLITERAQGITLTKWLDTKPDNVEKAKIALSVFKEVQTMHEKGIVHRDLKPDNIMVDPKTLKVTIIDLGVACEMKGGVANDGHLCGTPSYLPPSKCIIVDGRVVPKKDYNYTIAHDWYALGVILERDMRLGKHSLLLEDPASPGCIVSLNAEKIGRLFLSNLVVSSIRLNAEEKEQLSSLLAAQPVNASVSGTLPITATVAFPGISSASNVPSAPVSRQGRRVKIPVIDALPRDALVNAKSDRAAPGACG